jgi:hypothetical protein
MTGEQIVGLGARLHLFVHPNTRAEFRALFADTLECEVLERDFGLDYPVMVVRFPDGTLFSVETSPLAAEGTSISVTDESAFRGAWIEFRTTEVAAVHARLRSAGVAEFRHEGSEHVYFAAPGGQVFRVVDINYTGP